MVHRIWTFILLTQLKTSSDIRLTIAQGKVKDSKGNEKMVDRLSKLDFVAKYVPVIKAVFVRIYGVVNADMNPGYDYDIVNIGSNSPNYQTALSIKSAKNVSAVAKNSGVISIRPLEAGIKTYAIYIAGFWFV